MAASFDDSVCGPLSSHVPDEVCGRCIGRNPLKRITATKKMLDHFKTYGRINDPAMCPYANASYPLLECSGRSCDSAGSLPVYIVLDTAADELLFPIKQEDSRLGTLYISIVVFCAALVIASVAVWLEWKRRVRLNEDQVWHREGTPGNRPTLVDSTELFNDIRFDPTFIRTCTRLLARGGYGVVYLGTWKPDKGPAVQVAMKRLLPEKLAHIHNIEDFMDEIRLNSRLQHPNIVAFYGYTWTSLLNLSMVNEYMSHGDLWTLLQQDRRSHALPWNIAAHFRLNWSVESTAADVARPTDPSAGLLDVSCQVSKERLLRDVVLALAYLHSQDIIHRDLKAKNVMLGPSYKAKLTDFGTSRSCTNDGDETMTAEIGTVAWIAPEILKGVRYSAKADMYSLGVLLSEMDTLEVPYSSVRRRQSIDDSSKAVDVAKARIAMLVVAGELKPEFTRSCPPCIYLIAQRCLAYNPDDRPSAAKVLAWLNQLRQSKPFLE
ncbi:hypothetical protein DYB32_003457 [Aphanomyces invadans]|uniref:Protein kinase domain-containing protein n=1 Tax=Aphanomyces invadans TaxID=157072 RepID=A0A418B0I6_9STRA|nr:hypothetical protein DYB32_003457 [Aphanomyces invadans]